jgi:hypothetical protein
MSRRPQEELTYHKRVSIDDACSLRFHDSKREWTYRRLDESGHKEYMSDNNYNPTMISRLPASITDVYKDSDNGKYLISCSTSGYNPIVRTILEGTRGSSGSDETQASPLMLLREHETTLVPFILSMTTNPFSDHVRLTIPASLVGNGYGRLMRYMHGRSHDDLSCFKRDFVVKNDNSRCHKRN